MEESLDLYEQIKKQMESCDIDILTYSPLTLAYIGDAIYELVIRTLVVAEGNSQVNKLHQRTSALVNAKTQANMIMFLMDELTEEEHRIYKRGRNAKSCTSAKNASVVDYRTATGFEALMGYLYLTKQSTRMMQLIKDGLKLHAESEQCSDK